MILRAPAKLNLCLYLGPRREDGLHELCSLTQPLTLADRIVVTDADVGRGDLRRGRGAEPGRTRPGGAPRSRLVAPAAQGRDREADPGGGRARRRQRRRRRACCVSRATRSTGIEELAAELGADVPSQLDPGPALVAGRRRGGRAAARRRAEFAAGADPVGGRPATADVYAEADRLGLGRDAAELGCDRRAASRRGGRRRIAARLPRAARQRPPARRRCRCGPRSARRSTRSRPGRGAGAGHRVGPDRVRAVR